MTRGKKVGVALGVIVGLLVAGVGIVYGVSGTHLSRRWSVTPRPVTVKADAGRWSAADIWRTT